MRNLLLFLLLAGCAQTSSGIDWYEWTVAQTRFGMMRTERVPDGIPITRQLLVDNFRRIAFDVEADSLGTGASDDGDDPHLRKWQEPIYFEVAAWPHNVPPILDKASLFADRLASITGLSIRPISDEPGPDESTNLVIVYGSDLDFASINKQEVEGFETDEVVRAIMLDLSEFLVEWRFAPSPCAGTVYQTPEEDEFGPRGTVLAAIVVIKQEIPDNLLLSCIEEEFSQGLGLLNDDPEVRPSIFNDDQEFALLTKHDEYLLKILYDDRLEPGMTPEVAMPIVRQVVSELLPAN